MAEAIPTLVSDTETQVVQTVWVVIYSIVYIRTLF